MKISDAEREAVYKTINLRRDVRSDFLPDPISHEVLGNLLQAAHRAPSVGFMQPWDFIVIKSEETKDQIKAAFDKENEKAAEQFEGERREQYRSLKLEGILDAPLGLCVTCNRKRTGPVVLGRTNNMDMDLYSTICAIQNLWLAARAENIGMGWVSIIDFKYLKKLLNIPEECEVLGYFCLGYVKQFRAKPELEEAGWLPRLPLESLVHYEEWGSQAPS